MKMQLEAYEAVSAVEAVYKAKQRVPEELYGFSFFGAYDIWEYYELGDPDSECVYCKEYGAKVFSGNQLRSIFPDLIIEDEDTIFPNVHKSLWGADTCKCKLIRLNKEKVKPESLVFWIGERLELQPSKKELEEGED